jgi:hypothetical protein
LNLYGYANGDPVNFSDPFGLRPCDPPGSCRANLTAFGATVGTATGVLLATGCTATSGGLCVAGAPAIVAGSGAAGAALGAAVGDIAEHGDEIAAAMGELGDKIKKKVHRAIEIAGFIVGMALGEPPPKKPDDEDKKPPPPPASTKGLAPGETEERP